MKLSKLSIDAFLAVLALDSIHGSYSKKQGVKSWARAFLFPLCAPTNHSWRGYGVAHTHDGKSKPYPWPRGIRICSIMTLDIEQESLPASRANNFQRFWVVTWESAHWTKDRIFSCWSFSEQCLPVRNSYDGFIVQWHCAFLMHSVAVVKTVSKPAWSF